MHITLNCKAVDCVILKCGEREREREREMNALLIAELRQGGECVCVCTLYLRRDCGGQDF